MTKLRELKKKYEQSQLAERAAWGVLRGHYANAMSLNSEVGYSDYRAASVAWRETSDTLSVDARAYYVEYSSLWRRVLGWLSVGLAVTAITVLALGL
jgi:hypothetical protein